jgi:general secretion pathway protein H
MARGFTLIEVMVVMLIIGVMATTLTLSLAPDSHRQIEDEAYRAARVLEQAVDASEMGMPLGLAWEPQGLVFHRQMQNGDWLPVTDALFAPHRWPDGIHSVLLVPASGPSPWLLWQDNQSPRLVFSLQSSARRFDLTLSPLGRVSVREFPA